MTGHCLLKLCKVLPFLGLMRAHSEVGLKACNSPQHTHGRTWASNDWLVLHPFRWACESGSTESFA